MKFPVLSIAKFVVSGAVGLGAGKVVSAVLKEHVKPETLFDKVTMTAAAWAISGITATASKKYANDTIDDVYGYGERMWVQIQIQRKLTKINDGEMTFEEAGLDLSQVHKDDAGIWVANEAFSFSGAAKNNETVVTGEII